MFIYLFFFISDYLSPIFKCRYTNLKDWDKFREGDFEKMLIDKMRADWIVFGITKIINYQSSQ